MSKTKQKIVKTQVSQKDETKKYLILAGIEGFSLVCIELLGAKIIHAFYGSSLNVWTIVLSFTLLGVSVGYALGARLAKKNIEKHISFLCIACGLSILIILSVSNPLFNYFVQDDNPIGLYVSGFLIIVPPLLFLGALSPLFIQKLNTDLGDSGQTAGKVYAISTFGGIISAFLVGFFLLEQFGIIYPLILISLVFIIIGSFVFPKKFAIKLITLLVFVLLSSFLIKKRAVSESFFVTLRYENEGIFGQIRVFDKPLVNRNFSARILSINGISQTIIFNSEVATNFWRYPHVVNGFASFKKGDPKTLLLGLGGGSIARELKTRVSNLDVVEIDPRIIKLATSHFYLKPKGIQFINDDARHYIHQCRKKYDLVVYDVLTGETQPNYVFTREALNEVNGILNEKAIVIVNFQGIIKGKDLAFKTLYKTFNSAGFHVNYYSTQLKKSEDIVFVLSKEKLDPADIKMENLNTCCKESDEMDEFVLHPFTGYKPDLSKVEVLTDDKPILELLNRQAIKDWRKDQNETYTKSNLRYGISVFK